ncbi:MAG: TetR/AcrR family transcriptional regulator [Dehalococcoidia bacterium]|nr:TetR/AcrR family transcriptional regulator [Chloroflexi bacterium CFX7]MCK6565621.1 TetR/AcrR family transcriptional regulator [Dehalococcoidia bacterium]MCL4230831.1 TetR family transcriptional regulator [Dehalococcoidia bacterium]NUQ54983.1 TetR/AcrR family transcriptional regulator [Dehalococcoidia bacterium]RIL04128.1 MAG: hypothetical protein DCC78_00635 [bacterium]
MPASRQPAVTPARPETGAGAADPRAGAGAAKRGGDATRTRILEAAHELFATRGFDGTTVKDIGAKAGLTDAALYYHFRSKREILDAVWQIPESRMLGDVPSGEAMGPEVLEHLVDVMFDGAVARDGFLRLMARQVLARDRTAMALRSQTMTVWRQYMARHFETAFSAEESAAMADSLAMLIHGIYMNTQIDHGSGTADVIRDPAFRDRAKAMARTMFPLGRACTAEGPCEQ